MTGKISTDNKKVESDAFFYMVTAILITVLFLLIFMSLRFGAAQVELNDIWHVLSHADSQTTNRNIIEQLRMPRILLGMVVGINFALAGLILQTILRNPLADPGILGVSSGASLAVVISILLANQLWSDEYTYALVYFPVNLVPFIAMVGGILGALLVFIISMDGTVRNGLSPYRLTLGGVVVGTLLNAFVLLVIVSFGAGRAELAIIWLSGTLYGRGMENFWPVLYWTISALLILPFLIKPLSMLRFGDDFSRSMGLNVSFWRLISAFVAIGLTTSAVSATGPIGFIGLITPHFARLLVGGNIKKLIIISSLAGMILTVGADFAGRILLIPIEIPVGVISTLIGVPIFIFIMQRNLWNLK